MLLAPSSSHDDAPGDGESLVGTFVDLGIARFITRHCRRVAGFVVAKNRQPAKLMDPEQHQFLSLEVKPACLSQQESAWYLGYKLHDIRILVAAGLLRPLGHPNHTCIKYFALVQLEQCRRDANWLSRATDAIYKAWRLKNGTESEPNKKYRAPRPNRLHPESSTLAAEDGFMSIG